VAVKGPTAGSLLVIRRGRIAAERYYNGATRRDLFELHSATKSFTSALIGIALQGSYLNSVDQPITALLPEAARDPARRLREIRLRHLLSMTSGFRWDPLRPSAGEGSDWVAFVLSLPIATPPGDQFTYNGGNSTLLSAVISEASGLRAEELARKCLFKPLGIRRYEWASDPEGNTIGAYGLRLTARDFAKLGYLYLRGGIWNERRLLSADYLRDSLSPASRGGFPEFSPYGFHWWLANVQGRRAFYAAGYGNQYLYVVPSLDLVVVTTAEPVPPALPPPELRDVIEDVIVRAVRE
jgi:CubicO group peptidase (beta-lactamase class C family)